MSFRTRCELQFFNIGYDKLTRLLKPALKHYTSKLSSFDDLTSLHTFGFRGEALSSLCALADFHIVTAQADQVPRANRLDFEASGKLQKTQIVAGPKGTTASVEGIFKRLPVRRRELEKNIKREYGKVLNLLHAYACISTGVRFSVRNTVGKTKNVAVFSTNGNRTTKENIANVYGAKTLSALIPLDMELEFTPSVATRRVSSDEQLNQILVRGHISRPVFGEGRQTPDRQMFFVNSRPCGLPQIAKAFNEVYKSFNVSQSPFVFADFQMDTNAYDVNVSPDKRTILLHDAGALIESLKTSLAQLFEDADQTVPQSQVLGSKTPMAKQQGVGSLPGFVSARSVSRSASESGATPSRDPREIEPVDEEPQFVAHNEIKKFMRSQGGSSQADARSPPLKVPSTPRESSRSSRRAISVEPEPEPMPIESRLHDSHPSPEPAPEQQEAIEQTVQPPEQSSQSHVSEQDQVPVQPADEYEETPNVVQNAFDRMRPRKLPAEMATITIGDHTITSIVGSGLPRKRTADFSSSTDESPRLKRRTQPLPNSDRFGKHMRAFAAPGTQTQDNGDSEEDDVKDSAEEVAPEDRDDEEDEEGEEEVPVEEVEEAEEKEYSEQEDAEYVPEEVPRSPDGNGIDEDVETNQKSTTGDADEASINEDENKAEEAARVQRLIYQAAEAAMLPSQHNDSRVNKMNKGSTHRDSTVNLMSTIDASMSRLESQMTQLRRCLQTRGKAPGEDNDELTAGKTVEERLSLTVSKTDFAEMRIIGQFNLGFILAVRPGVSHDELFIIDQHASDEKFNFERLQAETVVQNQRLVRPQCLDLTAVEEEIVLENRSALEKNGFIVTVDESGDEPIGRRCQLLSLPLSKEVVFDSHDLEELIVLLSESATTTGLSVPRPSKVRKMFAMRACRSSIMIGKTLTTKQMQRVVRNMGTIDKPWNCPHGRPTMRHLLSLGQWKEWDEYKEDEDELEHEGEGLDAWRQYMEDRQDGEEEEEED